MFNRAFVMRGAGKGAAGFENNVVNFCFAHIRGRGQDADHTSFAVLGETRRVGGAHEIKDWAGLLGGFVEQAREINIQRTSKVPETGHCWAGGATFDLAEHGARDARQARESFEAEAFFRAGLFEPRGKPLGDFGILHHALSINGTARALASAMRCEKRDLPALALWSYLP